MKYSIENLYFKTSTTTDGNMSLRFGEEKEVQENRRRFLEKHNVDPKNLCLMQCDHGEQIIVVNNDNLLANSTPTAEALLTSDPNIVLGLLTADCVPAIFYDPVREAYGLAHLNRKTIAHDLAKKVVWAMGREFGTNPRDLLVQFEPHIKASSYTFTLPLKEPTPPQLSDFLTEINGTVTVDFATAHKSQLLAAGVTEENISISDTDVATDPQYFSHHAAKTNPKKSGRHLTIAKIYCADSQTNNP